MWRWGNNVLPVRNLYQNACSIDFSSHQKFVCTTIRPTRLPYKQLYNWDGAAEFVSDYLNFKALEPSFELVNRNCFFQATEVYPVVLLKCFICSLRDCCRRRPSSSGRRETASNILLCSARSSSPLVTTLTSSAGSPQFIPRLHVMH